MKKNILLYFFLPLLLTSCLGGPAKVEKGVSLDLARDRKSNLSHIRYDLAFDIPESRTEPLLGKMSITFTMDRVKDLLIDYTYGDHIASVSLPYRYENEHLVIDRSQLKRGENRVDISFSLADQSLNRRSDFLYTLLVPDRARTLFPCFDQPDLKSCYHLKLTLPGSWKGIANSPVISTEIKGERKTLTFAPTEPLSTYLFSFVAGDFEQVTRTRKGRTISMYHKETDPQKTAQCEAIIGQVFASLDWLEEYTDIPYPFSKYDFIVLPGFQFGGMEHTGATLYNDRRIFLSEAPTLQEEMSRTELIAHETSHMWFGDLVTMDWFSEVWTKEVFANYYASRITAPLYPDINHELAFMMNYIPGAYAEDRTAGSNPIQQELDNLNQAGLVYGNIIYEKSPVIMNMLVSKIGADRFRQGIRTYLKKYAYGNATWNDLIDILDDLTEEDLTTWSNEWLCEKGMPRIRLKKEGNRLHIHQDGKPRGQYISLQEEPALTVYFDGKDRTVDLSSADEVFIPNRDGRSYGYFYWGSDPMVTALEQLPGLQDPVTKGSLLIMANEAVLHGELDSRAFVEALMEYIPQEENQLLYAWAISYMKGALSIAKDKADIGAEALLWRLFTSEENPARSLIALRALLPVMETEDILAAMSALFRDSRALKQYKVSVRDQIGMCYELSLHFPEQAAELAAIQRGRIEAPSLREEFDFISPAVSADAATRDSVFQALLQVENREVEPWVSQALALLNHRLRDESSRKYILPGLEVLQQVQQTGDIFFPKAWASALLKGHDPEVVRSEVKKFFSGKPDYPPMLKNKVMMSVR